MQTGLSSTDRAKPAHTLTPLMKLLWDLGQLPSSAFTRAFSTHRCLASDVDVVDNSCCNAAVGPFVVTFHTSALQHAREHKYALRTSSLLGTKA